MKTESLSSSTWLARWTNSRGKLLTDFEHFKAMLEEYAQTEGKYF